MRTLEPTAARKALPPAAEDGPPVPAGRDAIRRIAVTAFAIAAMAGVALMLMDTAIDKLSRLSVLRLSGLF